MVTHVGVTDSDAQGFHCAREFHGTDKPSDIVGENQVVVLANLLELGFVFVLPVKVSPQYLNSDCW